MEHSFDVNVAEKIGIEAAIFLKNIYWWCKHNCKNKKNIHDGRAWTYNSRRTWKDLFPYMKDSRIRGALKLLADEGYIETGTFNKMAYDRTTWYTVTEAGANLLGVDISHLLYTPMEETYTPMDRLNTPMEKTNTPDDTSYIPDSKHNGITDSKGEADASSKKKSRSKKFVPPTLDEVKAYVQENSLNVDADFFYKYYATNDWYDSNGKPVKSWKHKCLTWDSQSNRQNGNRPSKADREKESAAIRAELERKMQSA